MKADSDERKLLVGCFMVVPLPDGCRLFARSCGTGAALTLPVQRLWLEEVLPVMLTSWANRVAAGSDLENRLPDLDFALPRGVAVRTPNGLQEILCGGWFAEWMHVTPAQVESALVGGRVAQWVYDCEFACIPDEVQALRHLLGLASCWGAESSLNTP